MTSQLQQLAAAIRGLADEAGQPMQVLAHAQQRTRQLALQAAALDDAGGAVAGRLFELRENLDAVSESMLTLRSDAHRFADFLAQGGTGARGSAQDIVEANVAGWSPPDSALGYAIPPNTENGRYRDPGESTRSTLSDAVGNSSAGRPDVWIGCLNPNYYTTNSGTWHLNCGPNARAFADVLQGRNTLPALGDTGGWRKPGELTEMWDTLRVHAPQALTNTPTVSGTRPEDMNASATTFTDRAYTRIGAELGKLQPGSVAIIGVDWDKGPGALLYGRDPRDSGGHWFSAFVDGGGKVWWADGQSGRLQPWPPPYPTKIWNAQLAVRSPGGTTDWKGVDL